MNNWNFTGNLGKDAEVKHLPSGDTVTEFSVAVKAGYGKNEKTAWAKCSHWGRDAALSRRVPLVAAAAFAMLAEQLMMTPNADLCGGPSGPSERAPG